MTSVLQSIQVRIIPTPKDNANEHRSITANLWRAQKHLRKVKREAEQLQKQHLENILNEARAMKQ